MQYSLGNMLKGGGALNPNGLALDLAFALDRSFATDPAAAGGALITSRRGPAAKFSRGSGATQVNAAGLIEYAPENLMLNSGNVSLMSRTDVPVAISQTGGPLGSYYTLGVNATNGFHIYRNSGVTPAASASSMMWVLAKRGTARYLRIGGGSASTFDWDTLTFSSISTNHSVGDPVAVGDGWYWLPILRNPTDLIDLAPSSSSGVIFSSNETANVTVEVAAIQVSRSGLLLNAAPTYYPTTTAAFYGPRFDHDPATGASKGLLIEEPRINYIVQSENFTSWWATGGGIVSRNKETVIPDPAGTFNSTRLEVNAGFNLYRDPIPSVPDGTRAVSIFARAVTGGLNSIALLGTGATVRINLGTGAVITNTGTVAGSLKVERFGAIGADGFNWWRISYATTDTLGDGFYIENVGTVSGAATAFLIFGAQFEAGAFPTSYIPTTIGTAARSADVCSIIGDAFSSFYNQSEGSFACDYSIPAGFAGNRYAAAIEDTPAGSLNAFTFRNTNVALNFISGAGYTSTIGAVSASRSKHIIAYSGTSEFVYCKDGTIGTNTGSGTRDPSLFIRLGIGTLEAAAGFSLNGHIARIQYFRKRLSNAKLQTLTAP